MKFFVGFVSRSPSTTGNQTAPKRQRPTSILCFIFIVLAPDFVSCSPYAARQWGGATYNLCLPLTVLSRLFNCLWIFVPITCFKQVSHSVPLSDRSITFPMFMDDKMTAHVCYVMYPREETCKTRAYYCYSKCTTTQYHVSIQPESVTKDSGCQRSVGILSKKGQECRANWYITVVKNQAACWSSALTALHAGKTAKPGHAVTAPAGEPPLGLRASSSSCISQRYHLTAARTVHAG